MPKSVEDRYKYWADLPPEESACCTFWLARIHEGWRPNRRIRVEGYDTSSVIYGVYIWEYLNKIRPLLDSMS